LPFSWRQFALSMLDIAIKGATSFSSPKGKIHVFALFLIFPALPPKKALRKRQKIKITPMSENTSPPLSPNAPPPAATNAAVVLSLLTPPSPSSPASPRHAKVVGNLFCDASEKRVLDLVLTGYSPAKKKGGRHRVCRLVLATPFY
jgi:hypothetical protein